MDLKYVNRPTIEKHDFLEPGTFESLYAAEYWARANGYSYGSTCFGGLVALKKGDFNIAKWKNLTKDEKKNIDGVMISNDYREGFVTIKIFTTNSIDQTNGAIATETKL